MTSDAPEPHVPSEVADAIIDILGVQEDGTWNVSPFRWPDRIERQLGRLREDLRGPMSESDPAARAAGEQLPACPHCEAPRVEGGARFECGTVAATSLIDGSDQPFACQQAQKAIWRERERMVALIESDKDYRVEAERDAIHADLIEAVKSGEDIRYDASDPRAHDPRYTRAAGEGNA